MLNIPLSIEEGATLNLIGGSGDVNWLRLKSGSAGIIWIRTINGTILIQNSRVSSWDPTTGTYDTTTAGAPGTDETPGGGTKPRSFIFARSYLVAGRAWNPPTSCGSGGGGRDYYEARMDVINSQIDHLGYHGSEAYGASWKVATNDTSLVPPNSRELYNRADVFGTIQNSTFTQNYFGAYTFGGYCMNVSGNHFDNNYWYGLDPHDDTDFMTVSGNTFTGNAGHGFICSIYCDHLVVQNNTATNNGRNGYMIHRRVDGAVITGNTGSGNGDSGLAVFDSYNASVSNNRFENNANAQIRLSVGASNNLFENNTLTGSSTSGNDYVIYTFTGTDTPTEGGSSRIQNNTFRGNTITGSASPVLKLSSATGNLIEGNTITAGSSLTTYEFADGQGNIVRNNTASGTTTINTFRSSTSNPAASSRLEDSPIEKSIVVKHSPSGSASTTVTDSRSYLASGMTMTAAPTGTSGTLTSSSTTITPRDFTIKPAKSSVAVSISTWNTSSPFAKSWTETASSSPGSVIHGVGNLQASTCYEVKAGSTVVGRFTATGSGSAARIDFTFSGTYPSGSALTFTVDSTTATCTNPGTVTPTATAGTATPSPTATGTPGSTSTVFSDGFESGIMGAWSTVSGITVQQSVVHAGSFAARANGSGTAAYARRSLSTPRPDLYYRVRFNIASKSTIAYLMRFRTASNGDMLGINVNSSGKLAIYNRTTGTTTTSTVSVSNGSWHEIQVHANQATGVVELWFDGTLVPALSFAQSLGLDANRRDRAGRAIERAHLRHLLRRCAGVDVIHQHHPADRHAWPDRHRHADADRDCDRDSGRNGDGHADTNSHSHPNHGGDCDQHHRGNVDQYAGTDRHHRSADEYAGSGAGCLHRRIRVRVDGQLADCQRDRGPAIGGLRRRVRGAGQRQGHRRLCPATARRAAGRALLPDSLQHREQEHDRVSDAFPHGLERRHARRECDQRRQAGHVQQDHGNH